MSDDAGLEMEINLPVPKRPLTEIKNTRTDVSRSSTARHAERINCNRA